MLGLPGKGALAQALVTDFFPAKQPDGSNSTARWAEMCRLAVENGPLKFEWQIQQTGGEIIPVETAIYARGDPR